MYSQYSSAQNVFSGRSVIPQKSVVGCLFLTFVSWIILNEVSAFSSTKMLIKIQPSLRFQSNEKNPREEGWVENMSEKSLLLSVIRKGVPCKVDKG